MADARKRAIGWVRAGQAGAGRRFAARHGFRETGQVVQEYRLYVPEAKAEEQEGLEESLGRVGLRVASLDELLAQRDTVDETFLRALQRLWADSGEEPAAPEPLLGDSFASWQREVLHAPGLSPQTD